MSDNQERDTNQRALGCISFSMLAHMGLLTLLAITPRVNDPFGVPNGSGGTVVVDLQTPGSSDPAAGTQSNTTMGPQGEQLLADANDPNAVALPSSQQPTVAETKTAPTTPPIETRPQEAPVTVAKVEAPQQPAAPVVPKPEPKVEVKPAPPVITKTAEAPKPEASAPTQPAPEPETKPISKPKIAAVTPKGDVPVKRPARKIPKAKPVSLADADAAADEAKNQEFSNQSLASFTPEPISNRESNRDSGREPVETSTSAQDYPEPSRSQAEPFVQAEPQPEPMIASSDAQPSRSASYSTGTMASAGGAGGSAAPGANGSGANGPAPSGPAGGYGSPNGMQVRDSSQLAQMPGNRPPTYPLDDRRAHREGTVVLVAEIMNDGSVASVAIERSSGSRTLDEAAMQAYRRWKYYPGQKGWVRHPFSFQLTE